MRIASLILLGLVLAVASASGQVLYENGPLNGTVDAWTINYGYFVSDTFTLTGNATVGGFDFYTWTFPGDKPLTVDWSITSGADGGTLYGSGIANLLDSFISTNQYGYDIHKDTVSGLNVGLNAGTYWLNLQNATTSQGNPLYWDENSGIGCHSPGCPSQATTIEPIPSESFDMTGTSRSEGTPEPGSIMLFGSGVVGVGGLFRRRLF